MQNIYLLFLVLILVQCKSTQQTVATATLENTYWRLVEVNDKPVVTPANEKEVHIILTSTSSEMRVKGFAGCNTIAGNFTTEGNKIHFNIISTKMYCQDRMEIENFFTNALSKADTYSIKGEELKLYRGDTTLITLKAVYLK